MNIGRITVGVLQANCYVVSTKKSNAFIVDPGSDADKIKSYINKEKLKVAFIINTHFHFDHINANKELGYPVYIHRLDAELIDAMPPKELPSFIMDEFKVNSFKPERLLEDGDLIKLDELELNILHTPGHSPGGISIKVDNVVFTGDTLFRDGIGRTDSPGGSYEQITESINNKLLILGDEIIVYPGHGESTTIGRERANF